MALAALTGPPHFDAVMADVHAQVQALKASGKHPVEFLQSELATPEQKTAFARLVVPKLKAVSPRFNARVTTHIHRGRALQTNAGDPGLCHILALGINKMACSTMSCFWRGLPAQQKIYDWVDRSLRETLDTTQRKLKLSVSADMCETDISGKLFFAGYAGGSSLGFAQSLLLYFLTQCATCDPWQVDEVKRWLESCTRIGVTYVVYTNAVTRLFDGWSAWLD